MKKQDYIVVSDTHTNTDPTPSLHALEIYTSPRRMEDTSVSYLRESPPSEEAYVMLPGEVIPFENYIDIQADLLYLAFFDVRDKLRELSVRSNFINYVIDVSGPSKASKERLFYSTKTPEDIRATTYGFISLNDFLSLYTKKDFSYGLLVEIDDYETAKMKDNPFFFRHLPWPILKVSADDEKVTLLMKLPDLEFRPNPTKILELITYYHKRVSLVLGMVNIESFSLVLLDLNEEDKNHELIGA